MRPRYLVCITLLAALSPATGRAGPAVLTNPVPASQSETEARSADAAAAVRFRLRSARRPRPGTGSCGRAGTGARNRNSRGVGSKATGLGRRYLHSDRRRRRSLSRLRDSRRQRDLQPRDHRTRSRRPSAVVRRAQRCAHQCHARRHAAEHAYRALLQRERLAGRAHHGHTVVYSTPTPAAVFRPRAAPDRRRQLSHRSTAPSPTAGCPTPTGGSSRTPSASTNDKASTSNAFFEFLGIPIFYLPYLHHPANETGRVSGLLTPVISNVFDQGLHGGRAGVLGHQPQHGRGGGLGVLQQARLGAQWRLPLQGPGTRPPDRALERVARPRRRGASGQHAGQFRSETF